MIKNILVDGVDCAGKSTLCKELKNTLRWDMKALGHRDGDQFERYLKEYSAVNNTVFERGHVSENIYSLIFKRKIPFSKNELKILDSILKERFLVVLCIPDDQNARERYLERGKMIQIIPIGKISKTNLLFKKCLKRLSSHPSLFLYQSKNFDELERLVKTVKKLLNKQTP